MVDFKKFKNWPQNITSCMNFLQTGRISLLRVAENIITCLSWGVILKISCTSLRISDDKTRKLVNTKLFYLTNRGKLRVITNPKKVILRTYPVPQASCRIHQEWNASHFSEKGPSLLPEQEFYLVSQQQCEGIHSWGAPCVFWCSHHRRKQQLWYLVSMCWTFRTRDRSAVG